MHYILIITSTTAKTHILAFITMVIKRMINNLFVCWQKISIKNIKDGTQYDLLIKAVYEDGTKSTIKNGKFSFKA